MFFFNLKSETPSSGSRRSGRLLELEQRMAEFLSQKAGDVGNEASEFVRLHREEVRRERIVETRRTDAARS